MACGLLRTAEWGTRGLESGALLAEQGKWHTTRARDPLVADCRLNCSHVKYAARQVKVMWLP